MRVNGMLSLFPSLERSSRRWAIKAFFIRRRQSHEYKRDIIRWKCLKKAFDWIDEGISFSFIFTSDLS